MKLYEVTSPNAKLRKEWYDWLDYHWYHWHKDDHPLRVLMKVRDGRLDYNGEIRVEPFGELPFPMGKVREFVVYAMSGKTIDSFKSFPEEAEYMSLTDVKSHSLKGLETKIQRLRYSGQLLSFEGVPTVHMLDLVSNGFRSLSGINKHVSTAVLTFLDNIDIEDGLLDVLRIPGIQTVRYQLTLGKDKNPQLEKAFDIITKHVGQGRPGIVKAHQELIDNDLEDFA